MVEKIITHVCKACDMELISWHVLNFDTQFKLRFCPRKIGEGWLRNPFLRNFVEVLGK